MGSTPAIVVSGHTTALGVVRALGEAGVPVVVLHYGDEDTAQASRHVVLSRRVPPPHLRERDFVDALLDLPGELAGGVLLPASDEAVVAVCRAREPLAGRYLVAAPPWEVARDFIDKGRTHLLACDAGVPTPRTFAPATLDEAREAARQLGFPLLVKPAQSHLYVDRFRRKMTVATGAAELEASFTEARAAGLEVLVQELVPGDDDETVNFNAYAVGGRCVVEFTARQIRKYPRRFGSPCVVRSERVEAVLEPGRAMVRALRLDGFACLEFKRDPRDGRFRILDVNGRHNLSGRLAVRCGLNFPLLQYRHLVEGVVPAQTSFELGVYWVDVLRDAARNLKHLVEERASPWSYASPYLRPHCDATFDAHDLRPFLARCSAVRRSAARRLGLE